MNNSQWYICKLSNTIAQGLITARMFSDKTTRIYTIVHQEPTKIVLIALFFPFLQMLIAATIWNSSWPLCATIYSQLPVLHNFIQTGYSIITDLSHDHIPHLKLKLIDHFHQRDAISWTLLLKVILLMKIINLNTPLLQKRKILNPFIYKRS